MKQRKTKRVGDTMKPFVGADRPPMLDSMVSVFIDSNPTAATSRDCADAMFDCGIYGHFGQLDFKRGYVAGFLYSIGIDRRTMKFTCDVCHKRKAAAKRSANLAADRGGEKGQP